jgi:hypothetical protein
MYLNMLTEDLLNPFWGYASLIERVYDGMEPARILLNIFKERSSICDLEDARPVAVRAGIDIEIEDVSFAYKSCEPVLDWS